MPRPYFVAKAWLAGVGTTAGLVGMALGWRPLVYSAVALLGSAFLLRVVERRRPRR